jgi:hypothetical protein
MPDAFDQHLLWAENGGTIVKCMDVRKSRLEWSSRRILVLMISDIDHHTSLVIH